MIKMRTISVFQRNTLVISVFPRNTLIDRMAISVFLSNTLVERGRAMGVLY